MSLPSISVKRPVTIVMITLIVMILGGVSLSRMPIDLLPEMEIPYAVVSTNYSGVGPQEIEKLITKPLEESVGTVGNIKSISSVSSEGNSIVIAEFNYGTDMDFASLEMREKIDLVKGFLPEDASSPMVMKIDPNSQPIIQLTISNGGDIAKLQTIAEDSIKPRLERLDGVASITVSGGYEQQVQINVNQEKMRGYGLTIDYLSKILAGENLNMPGGEVKKGKQQLTIRTIGEFQSIEEIKNLLISLPSGDSVFLSDIAEVSLANKEVESIARTNGKNSINISVQKQSGKNTVKVAKLVNEEIEKLKKDYPNIKINTVMDQSEYIQKSIDNVAGNAVIGGLLAVLILYFFLRNLRTTFIIGTAIPISIIATFILIYFSGVTINLMTLGGLALGVGMLVDNSIVVLENIYRFRQEGHSRKEAAEIGAKEVTMAITASTLTTVAVFLPIVFVEGITATIFKQLALTVTMSLMASLVVSLTLVPMLSSKLLSIDTGEKRKAKGVLKIFSFIFDGFESVFMKIENGYKNLLKKALNHRVRTIIIAFVIFAVSMASIATVGAEFFPTMDQGEFSVSISLPEGSELKDTDAIVSEVESKLQNLNEIKTIFSKVGSGGGMSLNGNKTNTASISVLLKDKKDRNRSAAEVADEVRELIKDIPGAEKSVTVASTFSMGGSSGGAPVSINIKGDDLKTLKKVGDDFKNIVESVEGTREVKSSVEDGVPEVQINIDRKNAAQYGLTAAQIASSVKSNITGATATRYKLDGNEINVVIKGDESFKESIANLEQTSLQSPTGTLVPLSQVAKITIDKGPSVINRSGQVRNITVTSQIIGRDLNSISKDIEAKLSQYHLPEGYSYELGGENKELNDALKDLSMALALAVILVFMILASQFESLLHPFTIMLSVPLAFSGGALGLFLTGKALSVPAFIGVIMLAGIVVNNAIVLVDYINIRRNHGEERNEAIVNAGPIRLRPILMTTLTTVLGLVPLALGIGEGAEAQAPMAIVVIGGLMLSTLLTLVFIPVVYTLFDDLTNKFKRKVIKNSKTVEEL